MSTLSFASISPNPAGEALSCSAHKMSTGQEEMRPVPAVQQVVTQLFPAPTLGLTFFTRFLASAKQEQQEESSPLSINEGEEAVICTRSIERLGDLLGFSHDATHRYVLLFQTLGILQKRKSTGGHAFVLSCGAYHPPRTLEVDLDALITRYRSLKSRHKCARLVMDVKARCLLSGLLAPQSKETTAILAYLEQLTQSQAGETRYTLTQRLAQAHRLIQALRVQGEEEPAFSPGSQEHRQKPEHTAKPRLPHQPKDTTQECLRESATKDTAQECLRGRATKDTAQECLTGSALEATACFSERTARYAVPARGSKQERQNGTNGADSPAYGAQEVGTRQPHQRDTSQNRHMGNGHRDAVACPLPDQARQKVSVHPLRHVVITNIYDFIVTSTNGQSKRVAEFFAKQLEHDRNVSPKYLKLLSLEDGRPRDPHVLAAAFICTLVRLHKDHWKLTRPGGFFTKRCREYDTAVPDEVESWLQCYGHLSPEQLQNTLMREATQATQTTSIIPVTGSAAPHPSQVPTGPAHLPAAPSWLTAPLTLHASLQIEPVRLVMNQREAERLAQRIQHDPRTGLFRVRCLSGEIPGRFAVLVDASRPGGRCQQTLIYSAEEWQARLDGMQRWQDLFSPLASLPSGQTPREDHAEIPCPSSKQQGRAAA